MKKPHFPRFPAIQPSVQGSKFSGSTVQRFLPVPASSGKSKIKNQKSKFPFALRRDVGFWQLTFGGQHAIFKHEQGAIYVAHLLLNPPDQPIHALALALRSNAIRGQSNGATEIVDPATGKAVPLATDATLQQRSLCLDDAHAAWALRRKEQQLEAILHDETQFGPVKAEVERELEAIYQYQKHNPWRAGDAAQKAADTVGKAIKRFYHHLARAVDAVGNPHPVLHPFAEHLRHHLLIPSGRCCARGGPRPGQGLAGCFTYDPPSGVTWVS